MPAVWCSFVKDAIRTGDLSVTTRLRVFHPDAAKAIVKHLLQPSVLATKLRGERDSD